MLGALLVAVDRIGVGVAERALASELQRTGGFSSRPEVEVHGVPFLTQALAGRYDRIDVVARDVPAGEVRGTPVELSRLSTSLQGADVPLRDALSGAVTSVPVERIDASAVLPFSVLRRSSRIGDLTVAPEGERLRLRGSVEVLGQDITASALSRLAVEDGDVVVTAQRYDVGNRLASRLLTRALRGRFDVRVPLGGLPYGLRVRAVTVRQDGLAVTARGDDTALSRPPS